MDKKWNASFSYQQHVTKKTSTQIVVTTTSILSLPSLVPTPLKLWLLHPQDIRKDRRSLDITIFHKSSYAPISKAQKCARGFRGEAVMHVWEDVTAKTATPTKVDSKLTGAQLGSRRRANKALEEA
jgi:hypothetical protein